MVRTRRQTPGNNARAPEGINTLARSVHLWGCQNLSPDNNQAEFRCGKWSDGVEQQLSCSLLVGTFDACTDPEKLLRNLEIGP